MKQPTRGDDISEVERRLPEIWASVLGISAEKVNIDPHANVLQWLKEANGELLEDFSFLFLQSDLNQSFGISASDEEYARLFELDEASQVCWQQWNCYEPRLTNRQLSEWIVDHMVPVSFAPVNIAGVDSGPAGAFWGIRDTLRKIDSKIEIAPSTPIRQVLKKGKLEVFWRLLEFQTRGCVSPLSWPSRSYASAVMLGGICITFIGMVCITASWGFLNLIKVGVALICWGWRLEWVCRMPGSVETFGDLARLIAEQPPAQSAV